MAIRQSVHYGKLRRNRLGLISAPICGAIIVAALIVAKANEPPPIIKTTETPIVSAFDTVPVPVPVKPVPAGARLKDVYFKTVDYPKHQVPDNAIRSIASYQESVSLVPLPASLPIFKENLSLTASASNPVIDRIPEGLRAITVRVDATAAVEGWAGSGAYVDVLLVAKQQTKVVAENVKILSAERSIEPVSTAASPEIPRTVTLLVTQQQALSLSAASNLGKLTFALRSNGDRRLWRTRSIRTDDLSDIPRDSEPLHVSGYAEVKEKNKAFALIDGTWIRSEVKPSGFFVGKELHNDE